ncbi:MAG TPA: DUF4388 domain-containing protein [Thermoanaerobaculia bacterium]
MSGEDDQSAQSGALSGSFSETPLFIVLRRIQKERLSGTLSVIRDEQMRQLFFENGELQSARSSQEDHRIGATLVRWGYISQADLESALAAQRQSRQRIDLILIESGLVTRAVIDSEARRQMEQIVFSTLSWPDGAFHFEANTGPVELDVSVSLSQEMIIEGIRRIPESEQFLDLLGDLSAIPTLTRDPMSSGALRMLRDAVGVLDHIDGKTSARQLLESVSSAGTGTAKILYSLLFAGLIEMHPAPRSTSESGAMKSVLAGSKLDLRDRAERAAATAAVAAAERSGATPAVAPSGESAAASAARSSRQLVLDTYRQLDWLSHYDLLGVSRKATYDEIEEAYRARARLFDPTLKAHPELVDLWRPLTVLAKWLKVAHGVLSNPLSRDAYDRKIAEATPAQTEKPSG